jgi:hypothetical protein
VNLFGSDTKRWHGPALAPPLGEGVAARACDLPQAEGGFARIREAHELSAAQAEITALSHDDHA